MSGLIVRNHNGDLLDIAWPRGNGTFDLSEANLYGANLRDAYLYGANLREANLREANLREASLSSDSVIDGGADSRGYRAVAVQGNPYRIKAGCHWFTMAEAREHWQDNAEAMLKIEYFEREAARRGWNAD